MRVVPTRRRRRGLVVPRPGTAPAAVPPRHPRNPLRWRPGFDALAMAAGDRLLDTSGNLVLDASGNILLSSGGTDYCCLKQVRSCATGSLVALYISKAKLPDPAADYYFLRTSDSTCYKALVSDPFVTCNSGLTEVGTVTTVASCADAACTPTPTPTPTPAPCPPSCPGVGSSYFVTVPAGSIYHPASGHTLSNDAGSETVTRPDLSLCEWIGTDSPINIYIDGSSSGTTDLLIDQVSCSDGHGGTLCYWRVLVGDDTYPKWIKSTGSTPVGTYVPDTSGCGTTDGDGTTSGGNATVT